MKAAIRQAPIAAVLKPTFIAPPVVGTLAGGAVAEVLLLLEAAASVSLPLEDADSEAEAEAEAVAEALAVEVTVARVLLAEILVEVASEEVLVDLAVLEAELLVVVSSSLPSPVMTLMLW